MINPMALTDKNIIITGAASGIGRETAVLLTQLGAKPLLIDINADSLQAICNELGDNAKSIAVDLTDFDNVKNRLSEYCKTNKIKFNGMVHCAGIPSVCPLRALSNDQYEKVMRVNTQAALNLAKFISSNSGHDSTKQCSIVLISSVYGVVGSAANVAYATSKGAIIAMTKALAIELASKNIRVNCVAPGFIKTPMADNINSMFDEAYESQIEAMHPLGWGRPNDIANAIAFLLSEASRWITGSVMNVDGGFTAQ